MPPIKTKICNNRDELRRINTEDVIVDPPTVCTCTSSKYCYQPASHIIMDDLSIAKNKDLRELLSKDSYYREPKSFSRKQNSTFIPCILLKSMSDADVEVEVSGSNRWRLW